MLCDSGEWKCRSKDFFDHANIKCDWKYNNLKRISLKNNEPISSFLSLSILYIYQNLFGVVISAFNYFYKSNICDHIMPPKKK